jgi:RNA polymerase sigma-70 factor (ECF subfamily)
VEPSYEGRTPAFWTDSGSTNFQRLHKADGRNPDLFPKKFSNSFGIKRRFLHLSLFEGSSQIMKIFDRLSTSLALKNRIAERRCRLYRIAYAWSGDPHIADDLAQEAITLAISKRHQLRDPTRLESWLYTVLNNCWREHLRSRRFDAELDSNALECDHCPERLNLSGELAERVIEYMAKLPEGQRQVLSLVALEGLSYREVAEILGIPMGTVMSRLFRARRYLADRLYGESDPPDNSRPYIRRVK